MGSGAGAGCGTGCWCCPGAGMVLASWRGWLSGTGCWGGGRAPGVGSWGGLGPGGRVGLGTSTGSSLDLLIICYTGVIVDVDGNKNIKILSVSVEVPVAQHLLLEVRLPYFLALLYVFHDPFDPGCL